MIERTKYTRTPRVNVAPIGVSLGNTSQAKRTTEPPFWKKILLWFYHTYKV